MTLKVDSYPDMNFHQRFPSSSNGVLKNGGGVALNGYARPAAFATRGSNAGFPRDRDSASFDPHSASFPDTLSLARHAPTNPRAHPLHYEHQPPPHTATFPDGLATQTLGRNGNGNGPGPPRGAPPAFVSATMSRGLRRADPSPQPASHRSSRIPSAAYRAYAAQPNGSGNGVANGQPNGSAPHIGRFPSQHRRVQAQPPAPAQTLTTQRRSSTANTVTNPQQIIWSVSRGKPQPRPHRPLIRFTVRAQPLSVGLGGQSRGQFPHSPTVTRRLEAALPHCFFHPLPSRPLLQPSLHQGAWLRAHCSPHTCRFPRWSRWTGMGYSCSAGPATPHRSPYLPNRLLPLAPLRPFSPLSHPASRCAQRFRPTGVGFAT